MRPTTDDATRICWQCGAEVPATTVTEVLGHAYCQQCTDAWRREGRAMTVGELIIALVKACPMDAPVVVEIWPAPGTGINTTTCAIHQVAWSSSEQLAMVQGYVRDTCNFRP
jgi:hypothetical protein